MHQQHCATSISHISIALSLLLLLLANSLQAAEVEALYEAEVPVKGQGAEQRRAAIREAFSKVLIKVSGSREIINDKALHQTRRKAAQYVQQYRYRIVEHPFVNEAEAAAKPAKSEPPGVTTGPQQLLWVNFDATAVNHLLRDKGFPVWGAVRPSVVIWLSQERQGQRLMLQPEMMPTAVAAIDERAGQRGLSIVLPMMDMEDHTNLPVNALWDGFSTVIQQASTRYEADVVVTGQMVATGAHRWRVEWSLYLDGGIEQWIGAEGSINRVVAQGVEELSDRLAERYTQATTNSSLSQLQVVVTEVNNLASYDKVSQYFESLAMVERVVVQAMNPDSGEFLLSVRGGEAALDQGVKLGTVLERVAAIEPVSEHDESTDKPVEGPSLPESVESIRPTFRLR